MKKKVRKILLVLLLLVIGICAWNYKLLSYGMMQLRGQLSIISGSKEIEEVLTDPEVADSVKLKLIFIQKVRTYAFDSLGMEFSRNYTTFYDQKGKPSLWVVTAAYPFELKAYEWDFPFLGTVSYKGFFKQEKGLEEVERLKKEGFDTDYGTAGGWSTLGWFRDPVLSNMLNRDYGDLANLILHELTHQTLFVPDSVDFNENLASFVGDKGARMFLSAEFGEESEEYRNYVNGLHDDSLFTAYMVESAGRLDSLYSTFAEQLPHEKKLEQKKEMINQLIARIDSLPFHEGERYSRYAQRSAESGNALFMSYVRYGGKQSSFEKEFRDSYKGNLRAFIAGYREKYPSL